MGTKKILFFPDRCFDCSVQQIETVPAAVIGVKAQQLYVPTPVHRRTTKQSGRRYKDEKKKAIDSILSSRALQHVYIPWKYMEIYQ